MQASHDQRARAALDPNARQVIDAAAILEISEYELLALAYREWYGRAPCTQELSAAFGPYMFHGRTPFWAVALARQVIALHDAGKLAESRFARAGQPPPRLRDLLTAAAQSVLLLVVFGLIYYSVVSYQPPG